MSDHFPPEIRSGLVSLRHRIRRIQMFRGLLRTLSVAVGGILVIVALDFVLAPLPSLVRGILFFGWLAAMGAAVVIFLGIPLKRKLPLVRLARWLEERHPELQERISTTLELSGTSEGISPTLLAELSEAAVADMGSLDPTVEVKVKRIWASVWPAATGVVALGVLLGVWPREMGRLLTRAVLPFSELGNAGAFRFAIAPGDVEVLEGDSVVLELSYRGELEGALELVIDREGGRVVEELSPVSSEDGVHRYSYSVHSAEAGFKYTARVARNESDRFEVKVYPIPRLLDPVVALKFPAYTGWADREMSLGSGIRALAGSEVRISGRLDTPVTSGELIVGAEKLGEVGLERNARGTEVNWSGVLKPDQDGVAVIKVEHQLGRDFDAATFGFTAVADAAPEVRLLTPLERDFRVRPEDQAIFTYIVIEEIGVARAEIEVEVDDEAVTPLSEVLPARTDPDQIDFWEGEAMVHLGGLVSKYPGARVFRMRLKISDHRPVELGGPGVGFSDWVTFKLDRNAESLARQKLNNQDADLKKTIEEVVGKVHEARNEMHQAKGHLREEEVTRKAEEALTKAREDLNEARAELADLGERMKEGVQEHRRDDVERASAKLEEAQKAIETAPLQDTPEARQNEVERGLQETEDAIRELQKLREEVEKDRGRIDDLAKLQEMAQKQEELARQAAGELPDEEWQKRQEQMRDQIRNEVRESPEAKAAAIRAQAESALELAKEAKALQESQEQLADISGQVGEVPSELSADDIRKALIEEQKEVLGEARQETEEARRDGEKERAREVGKAVSESEKAIRKGEESKFEDAARSARTAAESLAKNAGESPTQESLAEKQGKLAEAFEKLAEGKTAEARSVLEEAQNQSTLRELGEALAEEQQKAVRDVQEELAEARQDKEARAEDLAKALDEASAALSEARKNEPEEAAEAAARAGEELAKGEGGSLSQESLRKKQEKLAEAFEALAEGDGEKAEAALEEARKVPHPDEVGQALAQAQEDLLEGVKDALESAKETGGEKAEALASAADQAGEAAREARKNDAAKASEAAREAAGELAKGTEKGSARESLEKQQESLAEGFEALAEGDIQGAFEALEEMQSERLSEALEKALAKEQEAIVESARSELGQAREEREERANHLPEALAQAQAALEQAKLGDVEAAATAAAAAAEELTKGADTSASQDSLQGRQEEIAEALENLAEGNSAEALAALQDMQGRRAEALADAIREMVPVEGNPLSEAGQQANRGAQKAMEASQSQQMGESGKASEQHESAAEQFARAGQSLESASELMARQAAQAAQESENPNRAPAPGEPMAEALQKSGQAAQSGQSGQQQAAAEQAQAAAGALQQAAKEAMANMKKGGKPGEQMAQGEEPGEGEGDGEAPPGQEAKESFRQAQAGKGVPPELAKLGINAADWEKIQATLKTDVGGTGGEAIPEDYRGLVQKYFEQISKTK